MRLANNFAHRTVPLEYPWIIACQKEVQQCSYLRKLDGDAPSMAKNTLFMKHTIVNGLKISFTDTNPGNDHILFLIHGNSASNRTWDLQVNAETLRRYRIVAFDLPGHGMSGASDSPFQDYSVKGSAALLGTAIKQIAEDQEYFLAGFCSGSNIVAEMLADPNIKPSGIILVSTNIVGESVSLEAVFKPNPKLTMLFKDECSRDEICEFWESEGVVDDERLQTLIDDHQSVDKKFRSTLSETVVKKQYSDEIALIKSRDVPVLVLFGERDTLVNTNYLDDYASCWCIKKFQNAGHLLHIEAATEINMLIAEFCRMHSKVSLVEGKLQQFN
jgi:pimeloyl-ACP methyl ester carboxylesterase